MRSRSLSLIFGSYTSAVGWKQHTFISSCLHILFDRVGRCHSSSRCSPVSPLVTGHRCVSPLSSHEAAHRTLVTTTVPAHTLTLCRYVPCLYSGYSVYSAPPLPTVPCIPTHQISTSYFNQGRTNMRLLHKWFSSMIIRYIALEMSCQHKSEVWVC